MELNNLFKSIKGLVFEHKKVPSYNRRYFFVSIIIKNLPKFLSLLIQNKSIIVNFI